MFCPYCDKPVSRYPGERCPECWPLYLEALASNNFPIPLVRAGIKLNFSEWSEMKKKEDRLYDAGKTDEEVDANINEWAQSVVDRIVSAQKRVEEAQARRNASVNRARNRRYQ